MMHHELSNVTIVETCHLDKLGESTKTLGSLVVGVANELPIEQRNALLEAMGNLYFAIGELYSTAMSSKGETEASE